MKRFFSLLVILGICAGVYYVRTTAAEARVRSVDIGWVLSVCAAEETGLAAIAACDLLLTAKDNRPETQGYLLFNKAYALDVMGEDEAALAVYNDAEPLTTSKRRWLLNNRGWIHHKAQRWDAMAVEANALLSGAPDLRDGPHFGALRLLRWHARATEDTQAEDALALRYLQDVPEDSYALKRRIRHLQKYAKYYPQPELSLARLADLTRAIAEEPRNTALCEARLNVLRSVRLVELAMREGMRCFEIMIAVHGSQVDVTKVQLAQAQARMEAARKILEETEAQSQAGAVAQAIDRASHVTRAHWRFIRGDITGALDDLEAARKTVATADDWDDAALDERIAFYPRLWEIIRGTDLEFLPGARR
ncbi:MAG: hypothetical protein AAGA08_11140 [Pseudomonadota bacterium]